MSVVVDISKVTSPDRGKGRSWNGIVSRTKYFQTIRQWLDGREYTFGYTDTYLPSCISFKHSEDALEFRLRFNV